MRTVRTCEACPEQYDVFDGPVNVGYLRLRWGNFVAYFLPNGKFDPEMYVVYEHEVDPKGWAGSFPDNETRNKHMHAALSAIRQARNEERKAQEHRPGGGPAGPRPRGDESGR